MDFEEYTKIKAANISALLELDKSVLDYKHAVAQQRKKDRKDLLLGRAIHCLTFEPESFDLLYQINPYDSLKSNEAKEFEANATKKGIALLNKKDYQATHAISQTIRNHKQFKLLVKDGQAEKTIIETASGLAVKGRLDYVNDDFIFDLKTTKNLELFKYDFFKYKYHVKMAWYQYLDLLDTARKLKKVIVIAASKETPIDVVFHNVNQNILNFGSLEYERLLLKLKELLELGSEYDGRSEEVIEMEMPEWMQKKLS